LKKSFNEFLGLTFLKAVAAAVELTPRITTATITTATTMVISETLQAGESAAESEEFPANSKI
jgi:hypothetical protein